MGPLSSLRKLSRERVPESAQWLPAGLETRGAQILTYFPETVAGYQGWADRAQQGSCSLWGPQLRGTSDFLGSKLQGAEERDPGVCGAVQSGDPQDVPPWGGQPRGSPPHCVLLANREMGSSVPRAQAQGPASGAFCPSVCWLQRFHFFLCTLLARPLDLGAQGVYRALPLTLCRRGRALGLGFSRRLTRFWLPQLHTQAAPVSHCGKWLPPHPLPGSLVAEWKPWQQEAGRIFPSPRGKGSLFLGPEPSYSLVLHFDVHFNSRELALRVLGLSLGGWVSDLLPFFL